MYYKSMTYQLNSLRLGLIHEDNIYGKPTIFLAMGSQSSETKSRITHYKKLYDEGKYNVVIIPFDHDGTEPGDNYEIYSYYENVLGVEFYVTEKLEPTHVFFADFGSPRSNFTEYHFDNKNKFMEMRANE